MGKIKRILLATDFSENAGFAMKRAVQFAKNKQTSLTLLHIFPENWIEKASQWFSTNTAWVKTFFKW